MARKTLAGIGPGVNGHTPALLAAPFLALGEHAEARRIRVKLAEAERCPVSCRRLVRSAG